MPQDQPRFDRQEQLTPSRQQQPMFDRQDQLSTITSGLLPGEVVIAVHSALSAGNGFIGLTDRRVIFQDSPLLGQRTTLTSIPYAKVQSVSFISERSVVSRLASISAIAVHTADQTYEVAVRGEQKARECHDFILSKIL